VVSAALLDDEEVGGEELPVRAEPELDPALKAVARGPERVLLRAADAHHHGAIDLLRHEGGNRHRGIRPALRTEAPAAELGDEDQLVRLDADALRERRHDERLTLRRAMHEALAVLPVGER